MNGDCDSNNTEKGEREREKGWERREEGQCTAHKRGRGLGCMHQGMFEQEEREGRRSEERGDSDRRAGGREGDKQHPRTRRPHERKDGRMRQRRREETACCTKRDGRTPSCRGNILHVHDGQMRACGGLAMGSEEGGRRREEKKKGEAGRTDPFGRTSGA